MKGGSQNSPSFAKDPTLHPPFSKGSLIIPPFKKGATETVTPFVYSRKEYRAISSF
jgi:hypothetical protein